MTHVFADNQPMTAIAGTPSVIYTDPLPLGSADRVTTHFLVHYLWASGGTTPGGTIDFVGEVSNDGVNWVDSASVGSASGAVPTIPDTQPVYGAFIRYRFTLTVDSDGQLAGVGFDLHAVLDHA